MRGADFFRSIAGGFRWTRRRQALLRIEPHDGDLGMPKTTYRVVTRGPDGGLRIRDYPNSDYLLQTHIQVGVDDCSTDLELRGLPVFRGLVGPMPDGKNVIRYESPEVFESLTKEWTAAKVARRSRRRTAAPVADPLVETESVDV